jgi:hypothetical protein
MAAGFNSQSREGDPNHNYGSSTQNNASNQQEINLQKEINELRIRYEKQLRDQRQELAMRTRDL